MATTLIEPDRLFDRLWQPGHSFRPRCGPGRRWGMLVLLGVLLLLIGAYWFATDPVRVRRMAESYLSKLIGGKVRVGGASLSIFEGLRLSRVSVMVQGREAVDSTLFVVDSLDIQYDPAALLRGQVEATRLIATGPHLYLVENLGDGSWNYQRLHRSALRPRDSRPTSASEPPMILPEIVLRNARVEYSELRNGRYASRGVMGLDGRLSPSSERDQYLFEMQSRGAMQGVGPVLSGSVGLNNGQVTASLRNLTFGPDLFAMLPSEVRQLWQDHHLQGKLNIPVFNYTPATVSRKSTFLLKTEFQDVRLVVRAQELASAAGARRLDQLEQSIDRLGGGGFIFDPLDARLKLAAVPPDVAVQNVTGTYRFDSAGVSFDNVTGSLEGIPIVMSGVGTGYGADVLFHLHLQSPPGRVVQLQSQLKYLTSLPDVARQVYGMFRPSGYCTFTGDVDRSIAGAKPRVTGSLTVLDGAYTCQFFPYPIRGVTGALSLSVDPATGDQQLQLEHLAGSGAGSGPNANASVSIDGWVGPFDKRMGCDVMVASDHVVGDAGLVAAFPPEVREALSAFRSLPEGGRPVTPYPEFSGAFRCRVMMPIAIGSKVSLLTDIHLADAAGELSAFPYPLRHAHGDLHIRDGRLDIDKLTSQSRAAAVQIDGSVTWPTTLHPEAPIGSTVTVHARAVPIDHTLLDALPAEKSAAVRRMGLGGAVDVDGTIFTAPPAATTGPAVADISSMGDRMRFALDLGLRDVWLKTAGGETEADHLNGVVHLTPTGLSAASLRGRRGAAELTGSGSVAWAGAQPVVHAAATARALVLDEALRSLLPTEAQSAWAAVDPHGSVDAELSYNSSSAAPDYTLTLHPDRASLCPAFMPYALTDCTGAIIVTPDRTRIDGLTASHGPARVKVSGLGLNGPVAAWDLSLSASGLPVDAQLRKALPAAVTKLIDEVGLRGNVSIELSKLNYRAPAAGPDDSGDADIAGVIRGEKASLDLGMPVENVDGGLTFEAAVRGGALATLKSRLAVTSLDLAGRSVHDLSCDLTQPPGSPLLQIDHIQGRLAGGEFAGQASLKYPDDSPTRYSLNFVLRNADVRDIARQGDDVQGLLTASVALEGAVNDPASRRGRGDVQVIGQRMYQIPLLLGLLEVTDLALPSSSPFNEATARYNVNGQRINFDQVQMRSNNMVMNGNGYMDFGSKKVRMNFTTDNPNLLPLPLLHELWQGARQELLQIQVRGTIQSPKVNAATFHTFTTTVDEVFSGNDREK